MKETNKTGTETNYAKFKAIMAEFGENMDLNFLVSLIDEMKDVLTKHPTNYEAIEKEYHRMVVLKSRLLTGAICPICNQPLYLSDMRRLPNSYVCIDCDEVFGDDEVEFEMVAK